MTLSYGCWPSLITPELLTLGIKSFAELQVVDDRIFFLESRPEEAGRTTVMELRGESPVELTTAPFNVRSRVHEYGGGAYIATADSIFFVNFDDQNIYRLPLSPGSQPHSVTHSNLDTRFADLNYCPATQTLVAVAELHDNGETKNLLVSIDTQSGAITTIHEGHDFYAAPRLTADGQRLAFIVWDHPNMPWDGTQLLVAQLSTRGPIETTLVAGGLTESVLQPQWRDNHSLMFASDRTGFWNLYVNDNSGQWCVHSDAAEYAEPPWVFGLRSAVSVNDRLILATRACTGAAQLCLLDTQTHHRTELCNDYAGYHCLAVAKGMAYFIAERTNAFACIVCYELDSGKLTQLCEAGSLNLPQDCLAIAEPLTLQNRQGADCHAFYYPPCNPAVQQPAGERPPLLVLSHGGPTSACSPALNLRIQYYCSRGWAVADVNYAGSAGYGRAFRDRLIENWGIADVADCEDVATHLADRGLADRSRLAIKGGSAGGYTTLAALTFGRTFSAGASHYGIGDLTALAAETHKFEARYIDRLVPPEKWAARSPINSVDQLSCPIIFFQGADDRVVPPSQAKAMVAALRAKNLPVAYVEFAGEGHGFRQAANIQFTAAAEYQFFCTVFAIDNSDESVTLDIENIESWHPTK